MVNSLSPFSWLKSSRYTKEVHSLSHRIIFLFQSFRFYKNTEKHITKHSCLLIYISAISCISHNQGSEKENIRAILLW